MDRIEGDKLCSIYRCTNLVNGKVYIGFTVDLHRRKAVHLSSSKKEDTKFYRAIRKYGAESFVWEIIYQSYDFDHCLKVMEPYFIQEYDSFSAGYNSTMGGDGARGQILSEDARRKISEGNKVPKPSSGNRDKSPERLEKLAEIRKLIPPVSEETKNKCSESLKGKPKSKEHIEAMKNRRQDTTTLVCPFCGKEGDYKNMKRWHFNNCKKNPDRVDNTKYVECSVCGFVCKQSPNFYRNHNEYCRIKGSK